VPRPPPGTLTVTPSTGLRHEDVVRVSGTGWPLSVGWIDVLTCAAGAEPGDVCPSVGGLFDPGADEAFAGDARPRVVVPDPDGGDGYVRCDSAPGACVLVAAPAIAPDLWSAPVPLEFEPVPTVVPVITPLAVTAPEGDAGTSTAYVPVALSEPSLEPVTVHYQTFDAPALPWAAVSGEDYTATSGTITFPPLETSAGIAVEVHGDTLAEGDEMALVALTDPVGGTIGGYSGIGGVVIPAED
jgi:hypothetical protein